MNLVSLRILALGLATWCTAGGASAALFDDCAAGEPCRRLSAAELGGLRGGFTLGGAGSAMRVSFGIARAVTVNGELVAVTQFTLPDVGAVIASFSARNVDLSALASALQAMNAAVPAADARLAAGPAQGASRAADPGDASLRVNGQSVTAGAPAVLSAGLRGLLVQNGPGNVVAPAGGQLSLPIGVTLIQNTLNNQTIRALTLLNVSASVQGALSAARIQESVRQTIADSLR